ncbi:MAG: hypothetical protein J6Y94_07350, partial [Bacteriovoracaceae bacterium]|nr:hypothetical protein [Bacteriovoracaceae bacterium]
MIQHEAELASLYPAHLLAKFPAVKIWPQVKTEDWRDWHWQMQHRLTTWPSLKKHLPLLPQE